MQHRIPGHLALFLLLVPAAHARAADPAPPKTVRVAAVQAKPRPIDFRLKAAEALARLDKNLDELEAIIDRAAEQKCDALCFPEDTPGLLNWIAANPDSLKEVLPESLKRMKQRLGAAAARHHMFLICCADVIESDGGLYNTSILLGRDGKEIGRYHKACPTYHEGRRRGNAFPVFETADLGSVGMLICYDLVFPETARSLALNGADIIFFPTMGTAAISGDDADKEDDIGVQALRVRAAENFIWLVVAHRGGGAMIISPQGKIIARATGPDGLAVADIDPRGARAGGDAMNHQQDMRARLFRERNPEAFDILTRSDPPVLDKIPIRLTAEQAASVAARVLTTGEEEFRAASALVAQGKTREAIAAFTRLRQQYPDSWINRVAAQRLAKLTSAPADPPPAK
jgi:predicted amidohydrolase